MAQEIRCEIIHEFYSTRGSSSKEWYTLRLVRWNDGDPKLEFRRMFLTEMEEERSGECAGLYDEVIDFMIEHNVLDQCQNYIVTGAYPKSGCLVPDEKEKEKAEPEAPDWLKDDQK